MSPALYRTSEEHIFARLERIRQRAIHLVQGSAAPASEQESAPAARDDENVALSLTAGISLRLPALLSLFELSPLAGDVIVCLLAAEYDPFLRTLVRAVQREMGRPWLEVGTIAELLDLPTPRVPELGPLLLPGGPLRRYSLIRCEDAGEREREIDTPLVSARVKLSGRVARYLVGDDSLPEGLNLLAPRPLLGASLVPDATAQAVLRRVRLAAEKDAPLVVEIVGPPGVGKRFFAEGLAAELGVPLICADLLGVERRHLAECLGEVRREARFASALPCLVHWSTTLPNTHQAPDEMAAAPPPQAPRQLPPELQRFLEEHGGLLFLTAEEREPLLELHARSLCHVAVPFPTPSQRTNMLNQALALHGGTVTAGVDLSVTTRRFALDPARIEAAGRAATELAAERGTNGVGPMVSHEDLVVACRHQLRHDLTSLATRVTATHRWEDLVITEDVYHGLLEMTAYVRHAHRVYDEWGFGARHSLTQGVSALFAGPPGTGKTMCASVMACELDMELFRVDLSRIVSKWIGETEKNLGKVFDEAQRSNAIILFDEADSLFAKRTDVKSSVDRYANLEVNFLLQRMENFGGVTILTTNFEDTLDTAFKRRLTFRMRFEKPDAEARGALWAKVFPASCALSGDFDPDEMGRLFEMSGGNIRNAALRAAFLAADQKREVDMDFCKLAAEREAREMGLLTFLNEREEVVVKEEVAAVRIIPPPRIVPIRPPGLGAKTQGGGR